MIQFFSSLRLLSPTQVAELTLSSGALNNTDQIGAVFLRLEEGNAFVNVEEFLTKLSAAPEASRSIEVHGRGHVEAPEKSQQHEAFSQGRSHSCCCVPVGSGHQPCCERRDDEPHLHNHWNQIPQV